MARGGSRYGAGRPGRHAKAEYCLRLNIQELVQRKLLEGGALIWRWSNIHTGEEVGSISMVTRSDNARLIYSHNKTPINQVVRIVRTDCNFGGARPWFVCPRCDRRIGVLYLRVGRFMCRHCGQIVYSSQSEDEISRTWRRQSRLEGRLQKNWLRPKGMHHATHERILGGIFQCEELRDAAVTACLQRMGLSNEF